MGEELETCHYVAMATRIFQPGADQHLGKSPLADGTIREMTRLWDEISTDQWTCLTPMRALVSFIVRRTGALPPSVDFLLSE